MKYAIGAILGVALFAWFFSPCSPAGKNKTGHEYMPDMYHPVSLEANQYSAYFWNHWDDKSTFTKAQLSAPVSYTHLLHLWGYWCAFRLFGYDMDFHQRLAHCVWRQTFLVGAGLHPDYFRDDGVVLGLGYDHHFL